MERITISIQPKRGVSQRANIRVELHTGTGEGRAVWSSTDVTLPGGIWSRGGVQLLADALKRELESWIPLDF